MRAREQSLKLHGRRIRTFHMIEFFHHGVWLLVGSCRIYAVAPQLDGARLIGELPSFISRDQPTREAQKREEEPSSSPSRTVLKPHSIRTLGEEWDQSSKANMATNSSLQGQCFFKAEFCSMRSRKDKWIETRV